jgi:hypothetical protein
MLSQVHKDLHELYANTPLIEFDTILAEYFDSSRLVKLLGSILDSKDYISEMAENSYVHDNGFDKIVLVSDARYKLRLHIWWDELTSEENIHDHRWDFYSVVISGSIRFEQYKVADTGTLLHEYKYIDQGDQYQIEHVGETILTFDNVGTLAPKSHYFLSHLIPHRIKPDPSKLTSTIIFQGSAIRNWTRLFSDRMLNKTRTVQQEPFTVDQLRSRLSRYIDTI